MNETLIAELGRDEYRGLTDAQAADRLNAAVAGVYGRIDLNWLDALLWQTGIMRALQQAAEGDLPLSEATAEQQAAAISAAWSLYGYLTSPRVHPELDLSIAEVSGGLQVLVLCGVVPAEVGAAVLARAAVTRAAQLGLGAVQPHDVAEARIRLRDRADREREGER